MFGGVFPRDAFVAAPGYTYFSCDYSQNEVRILAHLCGDPNLLKMFAEGQGGLDVYKGISMMISGKASPELVTAEVRRKYTMTHKGFARR